MGKNEADSKLMFSVVIPTYNRADYLRFTLDTCLAQAFASVEFIVQDDDSTDHTSDIVKIYQKQDQRFKYCNLGQNTGMRGNFENSLANASGEYLIFLGGDDALIPNGLHDLAEIISRYPEKIITWPVPTYYYDQVRQGRGQIIAPHSIFKAPFELEISSRDYFERQAQALFYVSDEMSPMIYVKSAVPRKIIDEVKHKSDGFFFVSSTPDGYSGFALASVVESYLYINIPLTMHGVSPSSAGLNYTKGANDKNDHSTKFFNDSKAVPMASQLGSTPYSPLISLMTADFIFQTDNIFHHGCSKLINFDNLINRAVKELCLGSFSAAKIQREMEIIHEIAELHDRVGYLKLLCSKLRRKGDPIFAGDMISPNFLIMDAPRRKIFNVYDASKFVFDYRNFKNAYWKLRWIEAIYSSLKFKLKSYRLGGYLSDHFEIENVNK
jgi:glycosyltransferase involved in cell wall biosynthesis